MFWVLLYSFVIKHTGDQRQKQQMVNRQTYNGSLPSREGHKGIKSLSGEERGKEKPGRILVLVGALSFTAIRPQEGQGNQHVVSLPVCVCFQTLSHQRYLTFCNTICGHLLMPSLSLTLIPMCGESSRPQNENFDRNGIILELAG